MEKVHLALETVGLTAEKTKLEQDFREGTSELKSLEVRNACTHTSGSPHKHSFNNIWPAVSFQQKYEHLEQRRAQLNEQCKTLLRRAKATCNMTGDQSWPEHLRTVWI